MIVISTTASSTSPPSSYEASSQFFEQHAQQLESLESLHPHVL